MMMEASLVSFKLVILTIVEFGALNFEGMQDSAAGDNGSKVENSMKFKMSDIHIVIKLDFKVHPPYPLHIHLYHQST